MGIGNYNDESIHDQKSIFLPMFCRLSIKDVKLNTVPISAAAAAAEPSSPRVSCMGQVKRNSRVTGYPSATAAAAAIISTAHHHKHHSKPRKTHYFSTKTLLPATAAASAGRKSGSRSCRSNREICARDSRRSVAKTCNYDQDCSVKAAALDISKMDPPLPVVKREAPPRDEVNLWKRRFDGVKSMHNIEPIHLPAKKFQPPPTTV
ncbi:uncharacterized protein LOC131002689 [Salvia miltiorrhiza]|uniref:uncharacterized protein LOC131002689 n=1 Tax=Salvia miltiorrhiza TaxID=226208 RepID=UPI0025AC7D3E|nr:uncharacterized protein LOC131002689 [Salvia miltiorrhiza]